MDTRVEKVVVSGPGPDGQWYWRPVGGSEDAQSIDPPLVDSDWTSGDIIEMRVRREMGRIELVGQPDEPVVEEASILLNGEPLDLPEDEQIEPGDVLCAVIRCGRPACRPGGRDRVGKRRPVVVVGTEGNYLIVKPIFSRDLSS
jgi:hypothetical protein